MVREPPSAPNPVFHNSASRGRGTPRRGRPGTPVPKRASEKGPRTNQGGIPRAAPEKAQKGGRPRGQSPPTTRAPPPKGQEEEGEKYIIQRRQIHPDSQTSNSDRRKRSTKRPNYKGDQAKARAAWLDPVKRGIKESLRLGGVIWTCNLQGFPHVGFMGNMASDQTTRVPGGSPKRREFSSKALRVPVKLARSARIPPWENLPGHRRTAS